LFKLSIAYDNYVFYNIFLFTILGETL